MKKRIFIGGYMHSGTSLLQRMIGAHSEIYTPKGETKFIEFLPTIQEKFPLTTNQHKENFLKFCNSAIAEGVISNRIQSQPVETEQALIPADLMNITSTNHLEIFFRVLDYHTSINQKAHWLEKSPNNIFYSKLIYQNIPDARFVVIIRDVRDVLTSKKMRLQNVEKLFSGEKLQIKKLEKKYSPLVDGLSWAASARAGLHVCRLQPKRSLLIRYEDLVINPKETILSICNFLEIPFEHQMLEISFSNAAEMTKRESKIYQNFGQYRKKLSNAEIAFLQRIIKKELKQFNYEFNSVSLRDKILCLRFYFTGILGLADRLTARFKLLDSAHFISFLKLSLKKLATHSS